jgi:hypothetical protein
VRPDDFSVPAAAQTQFEWISTTRGGACCGSCNQRTLGNIGASLA